MSTLFRAASCGLSLSWAIVAGCGGADQSDLDLGTLPVVTTADEKGDSPMAPTFFWARASTADACSQAPCPTIEARQVNTPARLPIYKLDWRGLGLGDEAQAMAESQVTSMLLFGKFTSATAFGKPVTVLQVTRANLAASETSSDNAGSDTYYALAALTTPCMGGSCPTLSASMLNNAYAGSLELVAANLSRLSSDPAFQSALSAELAAGSAYAAVTGILDGTASVSQAFRPLGAPPLVSPTLSPRR